jgi:purine-binding chemotaxis protein CheW
LVLFSIDKQRFALSLDLVERVVNMVEIHPLPQVPDYIAGTINFKGELLPAINLRKIFLLPDREAELSDQLIIVETSKMKIALWVDKTEVVINTENIDEMSPSQFFITNKLIKGLFELNDERVLISNPNKFLAPDQIDKLKALLQKQKDLPDW